MAEWTHGGPNPRFIVTSLKPARSTAAQLYEVIYAPVRAAAVS